VGYYYKVRGQDPTKAQVARPSTIDKIGKSKKEIESETPTGWKLWIDLMPIAVKNAARLLNGIAPGEHIRPDLVAAAFSRSNPVTAITVFKYHIMETALDLQREKAGKGIKQTTKTEYLRGLEEKWIKMISKVNALPVDDKSFDAEVRPCGGQARVRDFLQAARDTKSDHQTPRVQPEQQSAQGPRDGTRREGLQCRR
jgi:hypothetical protein